MTSSLLAKTCASEGGSTGGATVLIRDVIPGSPPICRKCGSEARRVQDGAGAGRYDCPTCNVRFDLRPPYTLLETEGLTHDFSGNEGAVRCPKVQKVLEDRKRCGKTGTILRCANCSEVTYVPFRCGTRICEPCARIQADRLYFDVRRKLRGLKNKGDYRLRHVVLTIRGSGEWERHEIERALLKVSRCLPIFYRDYLRRKPIGRDERAALGLGEQDIVPDLSFWRKRAILKDSQCYSISSSGKERFLDLTGLVAAFEVGPNGNVHVHCLYYGPFRRQEEMSALWQRITGDSFILWVRPIQDRGKAVREITKYVVKFSDFDEGKLFQLCEVLEPYRRVRTYGAFLGVKKQEANPECWSCRQSGCWEILERGIPEERWSVEYATWRKRRSTIGKGHAV